MGGGQWGSEAQCILDKAYEIRNQFLSLCCLILPYNPEKKRQPSTAGLTERHFQPPAERSRTSRDCANGGRLNFLSWWLKTEICCEFTKLLED